MSFNLTNFFALENRLVRLFQTNYEFAPLCGRTVRPETGKVFLCEWKYKQNCHFVLFHNMTDQSSAGGRASSFQHQQQLCDEAFVDFLLHPNRQTLALVRLVSALDPQSEQNLRKADKRKPSVIWACVSPFCRKSDSWLGGNLLFQFFLLTLTQQGSSVCKKVSKTKQKVVRLHCLLSKVTLLRRDLKNAHGGWWTLLVGTSEKIDFKVGSVQKVKVPTHAKKNHNRCII